MPPTTKVTGHRPPKKTMKHKDCVRCEKRDLFRRGVKDGYHCCRQSYDIDIDPEGEACDWFWSRKEQAEKDKKHAEEQEQKRIKRWEMNKNNPPKELLFVPDYMGSIVPKCPTCGEMPYSYTQCHWCGQKFIQTEQVKEWQKPLTKEVHCISCGKAIVADVARSNGHIRYHCPHCGVTMMQ